MCAALSLIAAGAAGNWNPSGVRLEALNVPWKYTPADLSAASSAARGSEFFAAGLMSVIALQRDGHRAENTTSLNVGVKSTLLPWRGIRRRHKFVASRCVFWSCTLVSMTGRRVCLTA